MKKEVIQITPNELFKAFKNESIEGSFIASDNINDIIFSDLARETEILDYSYRVNAVIMLGCIEGYLKLKLGTKLFVLEKNMVLVILPKQIFEIKEISSKLNSMLLIMRTSFLGNMDSFLGTIEVHQHFFKEGGIRLPEKLMNETITIYRLIKEIIAEKRLFARQIIQQYVNILFYNIYALLQQQNIQKPTDKPPTKDFVFEKFIHLVEHHYKEQHEIGFYADKLHLTSKYLSSMIRSASGKTAAQWIREYLIIEARTLLKSGKMSIQQIAYELNFYDQSHFGVFFKKHVGCSPRAYQKM